MHFVLPLLRQQKQQIRQIQQYGNPRYSTGVWVPSSCVCAAGASFTWQIRQIKLFGNQALWECLMFGLRLNVLKYFSWGFQTQNILNPIHIGLFWPSLDWGGGWGRQTPSLHFLKTIEDIDMKLSPLIKCREINLLLLSYLSCDVTCRH